LLNRNSACKSSFVSTLAHWKNLRQSSKAWGSKVGGLRSMRSNQPYQHQHNMQLSTGCSPRVLKEASRPGLVPSPALINSTAKRASSGHPGACRKTPPRRHAFSFNAATNNAALVCCVCKCSCAAKLQIRHASRVHQITSVFSVQVSRPQGVHALTTALTREKNFQLLFRAHCTPQQSTREARTQLCSLLPGLLVAVST